MAKLRYYLFLIICLSLNKLAAQSSNLVIDAIGNTQFIVYINDDQQNYIPGARVVLTNLPESVYKVKLVNPETSDIYIEEDIKLPPSADLIYALQKDSDENYRLAFTSSKTSASYNSIKIEQANCYTENSKVLIHGPYSPIPKTRNFIVTWGSEEIRIVNQQIDYPVEVDVTLYVCENSSLNAVCPTAVSISVFDDLFSTLSKNDDELEKLNATKQVIVNLQRNNSCFTANQIKNLLQLFETDQPKLVIAQLAKDYLADPTNKILLKEAFDNPELYNSIN